MLGLRARFVLALFVTSAIALLVAAAALLPGLQDRLLDEQLDAMTAIARVSLPTVRHMDAADLVRGSRELRKLAHTIARRTGGRVIIVGPRGNALADSDPQSPGPDSFADANRARAVGRVVRDSASSTRGIARVAVPVDSVIGPLAIAMRRPLRDVPATYAVVRNAFVTAGLVALAVALLIGIALGWRLLRRLRRLRDASQTLVIEGLGVPLPPDRGRDELGDLARTLNLMRERLHAEEEARRRFLSTASHELRTPLASLSGTLELAEEDLSASPPDLDDAARRIATAREQSRRLGQLAADLLDITRIDAREAAPRREAVELCEVARAVSAEFEDRARRLGIGIALDVPDSSCWALGDPGAVARVARILIDNALRFAPPGQAVAVAVSGDNGSVRLAVADGGPGVPEDERERIFERFARGSQTGDEVGFGLGLAIGRELAQHMEGSLVLTPSDHGARFELELPSAR